MTAWIGGDRLRGGRAPPTAGGEPTRQRLLVWSAAAVAFVCGLALPFNVILYSVAMQDLRLLDLVSLTLVPLGLWACLHRVNLLLALILLSLLFVLPSLVHAVVLLDRHGEEYRDFVFPVRFLLAMPLCAVLIPLLESARHRTWFAVGLCLGCCLNVVPLVFQSLGQHELMVALGLAPAELDIRPWDIQQRPPGLHAHANATSAVVSLGVAAAAFLASRERQPWLLPFALAALLACSYYTETRSAFTVSLMTLSLALALRCSLDRLFLLFPLVGLAGLVIAGWSDGPLLPESFTRLETADANLAERAATAVAGLRLTFVHPLGLGRTLGEAAVYELTGVKAIHNSVIWLGVALGMLPALFALAALVGAATKAARPGRPGLHGLLAFHLFLLCLFEDHSQNQTFLVLLILLTGGWLVDRAVGVEARTVGGEAGPDGDAGGAADTMPPRFALGGSI